MSRSAARLSSARHCFLHDKVSNTPSRVASDLARARERLLGFAQRPIVREFSAVLETIRVRDEARRREILDKPGCSPCDRPAVAPVYFQTYQTFQARKKDVRDPTSLIMVDEAESSDTNEDLSDQRSGFVRRPSSSIGRYERQA